MRHWMSDRTTGAVSSDTSRCPVRTIPSSAVAAARAPLWLTRGSWRDSCAGDAILALGDVLAGYLWHLSRPNLPSRHPTSRRDLPMLLMIPSPDHRRDRSR